MDTTATQPEPSDNRHLALLSAFHLALLIVTLLPVLLTDIAPLADLPNHLARWHILANLVGDPAIAANYDVVPTFTPYLLVDWMMTPLVRLWGVYEAGRLFVAAAIVIVYGGIVALSLTLIPRLTVWPALALPLIYNYALAWGFLNYVFAIGLMFLALALWFRIQHWAIVWRCTLLLVLSAVLYLAHMLAFGLFAAITGGHALALSWRRHGTAPLATLRDVIPLALPFAAVFAVYFAWQSGTAVSGEKVTIYGSLSDKLIALYSPTRFTEGRLEAALLMVYLITGFMLGRRGMLKLAPDFAFPLVCLAAICLVMPSSLFGVWGVDFRLPPVLLMLVIATTRPVMLESRPAAPLIAAIITGFVVIRVIVLWAPIQEADRQFAEFRGATSDIAPGARVLVSLDDVPGKLAMPEHAYWHLAQLAIIERQAFIPFLFTTATQVRPSDRNRDFDTGSGHPLPTSQLVNGLKPRFIAEFRNKELDAYHRVYWADWPKHFDYVVRINPGPLDAGVAQNLEPAARYSFFDIHKIRK